MDALPTTCLNCRETRVLSLAETLAWEPLHGPGRCEPPSDELCGLDGCEISGLCQARSGCAYTQVGP